MGRVSSLYHLSLFDDYDARDAREQQSDLRVPDGVLLEYRRPRRTLPSRDDPSPRNIHVVAAASPRPVSDDRRFGSEYPRDLALPRRYEDTPEGDPVASRIEGALLSTETSVFAEATATLEAAGLPGLAGGIDLSETAVYELRTYELVLGYATVPKFLELYGPGLVDKLAVDDSGESKLLSLLHSEAGVAPLNTVVELWRHESAQGAQRSRVASRGATTWRKAIGDIAEIATRFETQLLRPCVMMKHVE